MAYRTPVTDEFFDLVKKGEIDTNRIPFGKSTGLHRDSEKLIKIALEAKDVEEFKKKGATIYTHASSMYLRKLKQPTSKTERPNQFKKPIKFVRRDEILKYIKYLSEKIASAKAAQNRVPELSDHGKNELALQLEDLTYQAICESELLIKMLMTLLEGKRREKDGFDWTYFIGRHPWISIFISIEQEKEK